MEQIIRMSLTAAIVILVVIAIRFFMRKLPKKYTYMLWAAVGFRLLCPVSIESRFSIFSLKPASKVATKVERSEVYTNYVRSAATQRSVTQAAHAAQRTHETTAQTVAPHASQAVAVTEKITAPDPHTIMMIAWAVIAVIILGLAIYHLIKLKIRVRDAKQVEKGIFESSRVTSPFAMGIIRPGIYLPTDLPEYEREYLIEHERTHIKRGDLIFKAAAVAALAVHWFNPLVWIAFVLFCRDMEMSCDEIVLEKLGDGIRKNYSLSLVTLAQNSNDCSYVVMPTSFSKGSVGKSEVKMRIKNIMSFKKRSRSVAAVTSVIVVMVMITCVLNACSSPEETAPEETTAQTTAATTVEETTAETSETSDEEDYGDLPSTNGELEDQLEYMVLVSDYPCDETLYLVTIDDLSDIEDLDIRAVAETYSEQGYDIYDQENELNKGRSLGDGEYMFKYGFYATYSYYSDDFEYYESNEVWVYKMNEELFDYFMIDYMSSQDFCSFDKPRDTVEDDGTVIRYTDSLSGATAEFNRETGIGSLLMTSSWGGDTIENEDLLELMQSYEDQGYFTNLFDPDSWYYYEFFYEEAYPYGAGFQAELQGDPDPVFGSIPVIDMVYVFEADEDLFDSIVASDWLGEEVSREDDGTVISVQMHDEEEYEGETYSYDYSLQFNRDTNIVILSEAYS